MASAAGTKPLTSSVFYILLALADGDRHGLGIADEVEARTNGSVLLGPGTLYNAIKKMLASGLITDAERPKQELDDPRRRYYRITQRGRNALRDEAARLEVVVQAIHDKSVLSDTGPTS